MKTTTQSRNQRQEHQEKALIDYYPFEGDYGHLIVYRFRPDGSREIIGEVFSEVDGDDTRYITTNHKGRDLFSVTNDFNTVNNKFERYAQLLAVLQGEKKVQINNQNNKQSKNLNVMQTQSQNPKQKKVNQLIFVEYEKVAGDGHFTTVVDSYRNVIGRIHKSYNDETGKYDYIAYDHAGNLMAQNDKLWELKKEFINNRDHLLEQAHQRRIESKKLAQQTQEPAQRLTEEEKRKHQVRNLRSDKKLPEKNISKDNIPANDKQNPAKEREQELKDIRDEQENDIGDVEIDF